MFGPYIRTILLINDVTAAVVALISNAFLIFLVIKHTPTVLKPYSRILLQTCAIDLMFTFVIFVLRPVNFHIQERKILFSASRAYRRYIYLNNYRIPRTCDLSLELYLESNMVLYHSVCYFYYANSILLSLCLFV